MKGGKAHGRGHATCNEETYEGSYECGLRHGFGEFKYSNGERYKGDFRENQRHGKGEYFYSNGET